MGALSESACPYLTESTQSTYKCSTTCLDTLKHENMLIVDTFKLCKFDLKLNILFSVYNVELCGKDVNHIFSEL